MGLVKAIDHVQLAMPAGEAAEAMPVIEDLRHRAAAAGYAIRDDEPLVGYRRIYLSDPFGNCLEFMQPGD